MDPVQVAVTMNPLFPLTHSASEQGQSGSKVLDWTEIVMRVQGFIWGLKNVYLADDYINRLIPLFLKDPMLNDSIEIADRRSIVQEQVRSSLSSDKFVHGCGIEVCLRKDP